MGRTGPEVFNWKEPTKRRVWRVWKCADCGRLRWMLWQLVDSEGARRGFCPPCKRYRDMDLMAPSDVPESSEISGGDPGRSTFDAVCRDFMNQARRSGK